MATRSVPLADSSVLGESWVVADTNPQLGQRRMTSETPRKREDEVKPRRSNSQPAKPTESLASSIASSISGPELIMPSIYDDTISEASWIAPKLRHRENASKKRNKTIQHFPEASQEKPCEPKAPRVAASDPPTTPPHTSRRLSEQTWGMIQSIAANKFTRNIVTVFLLLSILHLLVLPELLYQYPKICSLSLFSTHYPASCAERQSGSQVKRLSPSELRRLSQYRSVVTSQTQFENVLDATVQEISLVPSPLKKEESALRDLYSQLKTAHTGAKYELDLEFQGAWPAIRSASLQLDLLKADMVSAMDRLEEESRMTAQSLKVSNPMQDEGQESEKGSSSGLLSFQVDFSWPLPRTSERSFPNQISHHVNVLQRQASLIRSRAESVLSDVAKLDEHLESIEDVLSREERASSNASKGNIKSLASDATHFIRRVSSLLFDSTDATPAESKDKSMSSLLRQAVSHHRRVAEALRKLDSQLQMLQQRHTP